MENKLTEQEKFGLVVGELRNALENIRVIIERHVVNDGSFEVKDKGLFDGWTGTTPSSEIENPSGKESTEITKLELADLIKQIETLKMINEKQEKKIKELENKNSTILEMAEEHRLDSQGELSIKRLNNFVEELLQNEKTNIGFIPDFAERQIYRNTFKILFKLMDKLFETTSIKFMGHKLKLDIEPLKDSEMDDPEYF